MVIRRAIRPMPVITRPVAEIPTVTLPPVSKGGPPPGYVPSGNTDFIPAEFKNVTQERRREFCMREVTKLWDLNKYRSKWTFDAGWKVKVFSPDKMGKEFLVEFYPGLRLVIPEDALEEFTKEV